jgi:NTE family protein
MEARVKLFRKKPKRIGLALGGGGARGLAHIHVLETLDELGVRPAVIAGTSIGAIMGSLYASGMSGTAIRTLVDHLLLRDITKISDVFTRKDLLKWIGMFDPSFRNGSLVKGEKFIQVLSESMKCSAFEELEIPLLVSTTDFSSGREVVFESGDLLLPVRASMAIPGVFKPVKHHGKLLVDGGLVNPLPYDLLADRCDFIIAVDVSGSMERPLKNPDFLDATLGSFDIVQSSLIAERFQRLPPDVYLKPALRDIRILEFNRADDIYAQSVGTRTELRQQLKRIL